MTRTFEAIYENGLLRPLEAVDLPTGRPLHVRVEESLDGAGRRARREAFQRFRESVEQGNFNLIGPLPTRDELHER